MIADRKKFILGLGMIIVFTAILVTMFMPVFGGQNAFAYSDELYNSVSKDSAYYIPDVLEDSEAYVGTPVNVEIKMTDVAEAEKTELLYQENGASVTVTEATLEIEGDLGIILIAALEDADSMYYNDGAALTQKYGYDEREVIYLWHKSLGKIEKELKKLDLFDESEAILEAQEKAIEPAYNYIGVEPQAITEKAGFVVGSLFFYIFYTVLYGFGLMYLLEGLGIKTGH